VPKSLLQTPWPGVGPEPIPAQKAGDLAYQFGDVVPQLVSRDINSTVHIMVDGSDVIDGTVDVVVGWFMKARVC
jgi:hypothetical protein